MKITFSLTIALVVAFLAFVTFMSVSGALFNLTFTDALKTLPLDIYSSIIGLACGIKSYLEFYDYFEQQEDMSSHPHIYITHPDHHHMFI